MLESKLYIQYMSIRGNLTDMSTRDRAAWGPYWKAVVAFTVTYQAGLFLALWLVPDENPSLFQRLLMLIPVLPFLAFVRAYLKFLSRLDEYGQLVQFKGLSAGFGVAIVVAMVVGFVGLPGDATLFNKLAPWIVLASGMLAWAVSLGVQFSRNS